VNLPPDQRGYVPPGVNASIWLGFEGKIRERRFRALLANAERALEAGDPAGAAEAVDEASQLSPDSREVLELRNRIRRHKPTARPALLRWMRPLNAALLLYVGIALLTLTDVVRNTKPREPEPATVVSAVRSPSPVSSAPLLPPSPLSTAPDAGAPIQIESNRARPMPVIARREESDGTVARRREIAPATSLPVAVAVEPEPVPLVRRDRLTPPVALDVLPPGAPPAERAAATAAPPAPPAPPGPPAPPVPAVAEENRVAAVLDAYVRAYTRLDARAARDVWPSVDERALARAFAGLASQGIAFDDCSIDVNGSAANAACRGTATYVAKVGRDDLRIEARTWRFELQRDGEEWKIASAVTRRP
jgi:hypothetical protein